jgi:putative NADH-flavin reductase
MRIAIFGSTGEVGRHMVRQALERDWEVVAFARTPDKLGELRERVEVVEGDIRDPEAVRRAIGGVGAVFSAIGHTKSSADDVLEVTADHLIDAMDKQGVDRLITLLGAGAQTDEDPSSVGRWVMLKVMGLVAGTMLQDAQAHADRVIQSDLDWTVVRPPRLTDEPATGQIRAGIMKLGPSSSISRADLATFMLDQVESDEWVGKAPMVAGGGS